MIRSYKKRVKVTAAHNHETEMTSVFSEVKIRLLLLYNTLTKSYTVLSLHIFLKHFLVDGII